MTGKEMIKIIQDNNLEDFELKIVRAHSIEGGWGHSIETFYIDEMIDIGHSDKTVSFDIIEK